MRVAWLATWPFAPLGSIVSPALKRFMHRMLEEFSKASKSFSISSATRVGHAEQIPAEANEFDLAISRLAPHHFSDIKIAIAELYRVTKPRSTPGQ
jgi:ubiquinone/menaquinone biosynthesis C-methylase UbiE